MASTNRKTEQTAEKEFHFKITTKFVDGPATIQFCIRPSTNYPGDNALYVIGLSRPLNVHELQQLANYGNLLWLNIEKDRPSHLPALRRYG